MASPCRHRVNMCEKMKKECSCDGLKEDNNWQIDQLRKEIMHLGHDARLHSILFDILDLIQGIKNEN